MCVALGVTLTGVENILGNAPSAVKVGLLCVWISW